MILSSGFVAVRSPAAETLTGPDLSDNVLTLGAKAEVAVLLKREKTCGIAHVVTWVGCWWLPSQTAPGIDLVNKVDSNTSNIPFECYIRCKLTAIEGTS